MLTKISVLRCEAISSVRLLVDFAPAFVRADGGQFAGRDLDRQIQLTLMADVDDRAVGLGFLRGRSADQETGDVLDRALRGRKPDARRLHAGQMSQPLEREGQMAAALVACQGVDFVDDHGPHAPQHLAAADASEQQVERLGRGYQNMRWMAEHRLTLGGRRIAGADRGPDGRSPVSGLDGRGPNLGQRHFEVAMNVVGQRLERRDIDDLRFARQLPGRSLSK